MKDRLDSELGKRIFARDRDVVSRKIGGELFLVPVKGKLADMEKIFTLTAVAEFIWDRLDGRRNVSDICDDVVAEFDVDKEQADSDTREFIEELAEAGLIREGEGAI